MGFEPNSGMGAAALMYQKLKNEINSTLEKGKIMKRRVETSYLMLYLLIHLTFNHKFKLLTLAGVTW